MPDYINDGWHVRSFNEGHVGITFLPSGRMLILPRHVIEAAVHILDGGPPMPRDVLAQQVGDPGDDLNSFLARVAGVEGHTIPHVRAALEGLLMGWMHHEATVRHLVHLSDDGMLVTRETINDEVRDALRQALI